jgi:hypothetical protein
MKKHQDTEFISKLFFGQIKKLTMDTIQKREYYCMNGGV